MSSNWRWNALTTAIYPLASYEIYKESKSFNQELKFQNPLKNFINTGHINLLS